MTKYDCLYCDHKAKNQLAFEKHNAICDKHPIFTTTVLALENLIAGNHFTPTWDAKLNNCLERMSTIMTPDLRDTLIKLCNYKPEQIDSGEHTEIELLIMAIKTEQVKRTLLADKIGHPIGKCKFCGTEVYGPPPITRTIYHPLCLMKDALNKAEKHIEERDRALTNIRKKLYGMGFQSSSITEQLKAVRKVIKTNAVAT